MRVLGIIVVLMMVHDASGQFFRRKMAAPKNLVRDAVVTVSSTKDTTRTKDKINDGIKSGDTFVETWISGLAEV